MAVVPPVLASARLGTMRRVEAVGVAGGKLAPVDRRVMQEFVVAAGRVGAAFKPDDAGQLLLVLPIRVLVAWLDGLVEILVSVEFTGSPQSFGAYIISQATGFLRLRCKALKPTSERLRWLYLDLWAL